MMIDPNYQQPVAPNQAQTQPSYEWNPNAYTQRLGDVLSGNYAPAQGWSQGGWQSIPGQAPAPQPPPQGNPYSGGGGSGNSYWNTPSTGFGQIQR